MILSSLIFVLLFLPLILAVYHASPKSLQNIVLLSGSLLFYAWGEKLYVLVLIVSILINYSGGLLIHRHRGNPGAKRALVAAIVLNVSILGVFKYTNFLVDTLNDGLALFGLPAVFLPPVHLPIGISFFTFQALSYIIDVYKGRVEAQRSFLKVSLYISLFPQLIAGPIVRYRYVARDLEAPRRVAAAGFALGVERFVIGLAKKVLLADSMAAASGAVYALPPSELTPGVAWLGACCAVLQVYFDFCGYSDMAVGLGRMFGFRFPENFNYPFVARSMHQFWTRWHISLTRWVRDYLFIPMGGLRRPARNARFPGMRLYAILFSIFLLVGLWHGARWNFVVWGGLHGLLIIAERTGLRDRIAKWPALLQHAYVLTVFIVTGVFFMAPTVGHAFQFVAAMFGHFHGTGAVHNLSLHLDGHAAFFLVVACVAATPVLPRLKSWKNRRFDEAGDVRRGRLLSAGYNLFLAGLLILSLMRMASGVYQPFIYYRF